MEHIIQNIIKNQNKELLKEISKEYKLDENILLQKYHTPTFYGVQIDKEKKYNIIKK